MSNIIDDRGQFYIDRAEQQLREQAETMAERLRRQADSIEKSVEDLLTRKDSYGSVPERAGWLVNEINFTFANLNTQDLVVRAAELDKFRTAAETEES